MIRAFIAIPLPEEINDSIQGMVSGLREKNHAVRWVRPEGMHLTLKFLGNIDESLVEPLSLGLDDVVAKYACLELKLSGLGVFPHVRRPRIVWIGLTGDIEKLAHLAGSIDDLGFQFGIERERREFSSHITLGRLKVPTMVDLGIDFTQETFTATQVLLFQSKLSSQGARYSVLHRSVMMPKGG
ncbi:MAG: RNA 2',3'-cyclic phosphodiesterase [Deltaproteobacteria bacterium]|nr:RNA 2',3'-cyclic phosphodiesterase [Deltaproteobacteria bacterium]